MPCYHPIQAYYGDRKPNGKSVILFKETSESRDSVGLKLPCGQCVGCRLERSRRWAMRCYFENEMCLQEDGTFKSSFITLTFDDENLLKRSNPFSLDVSEFQRFMKRLRKRCGNGIRFFHCGEYGELYGRPHYHACIFGFDFPDKTLHSVKNGFRLYKSELLRELWPFGNNIIGDVTFESAAYVARYIMKKITGKDAKEHYEVICTDTGEVFDRKPEYTTMSRRPGIGASWFDEYYSDVYPKDFVTVRGRKMKPPPFFDNKFNALDSDIFFDIKVLREDSAYGNVTNNTPERLRVREQCQLAKLNLLKRDLE